MSALTTDNKQTMVLYLEALSGQPKTEALLDRFMTDPILKEHIRTIEAAFPEYLLETRALVVEGDIAALRGTFRGRHLGAFAGIEATGKDVSADLMLFYRLADGRIAEHWMQLDMPGLMKQLTTE